MLQIDFCFSTHLIGLLNYCIELGQTSWLYIGL